VEGIAAQGTGVDPMDEKNHLAKVRVAGSNPVVCSTKNTLIRRLICRLAHLKVVCNQLYLIHVAQGPHPTIRARRDSRIRAS
jgi:hypothetical protein